MTFKKISSTQIRQDLVIEKYVHEKTGALHTHMATPGKENAFSIAFNTPAHDDRGIPHILEHMVLEGSKKYPLHNMFYSLEGKNFETMLNASTSTYYTQYYFGSNLEEGFLNLADVYLDAVLNPLLNEKTFLQEGFRYDIKENKELAYTGIVYNEMMAWVGKKDFSLYYDVLKTLIPEHPYSSYTGGDPIEISNNKYQDILDFHAKCYHPSNSHVFTTSELDVKKIHAKLDEFFDKFDKQEALKMPAHNFYDGGFAIKKSKHSGDENVSAYFNVNMGEYSVKSEHEMSVLKSLVETRLQDYIVNRNMGVLLMYLDTIKVGDNTILTGLFQLDSEEQLEELYTLWSDAWQNIVETGVEAEFLNAKFDKIYEQLSADKKMGYALSLNGKVCYFHMIGAKDCENIFEKEVFVKLQDEFLNTNKLIELINGKILQKKNILINASVPDENFVEEYKQRILEKEQKDSKLYSEEERVALANKFKELQAKELEDEKVKPVVELPKVVLDKAFAEKVKQGLGVDYKTKSFVVDGQTITLNDFENENLRADVMLKYNVAAETEEELLFECLQCAILEHTQYKGMSRDETVTWQQSGVMNLDLSLDLMRIGNEVKLVLNAVGKGYKNQLDTLLNKTSQLNFIQDFDKEYIERVLNVVLSEEEEMSGERFYEFVRYFSSLKNPLFRFRYLNEVKVIRWVRKFNEEIQNGDFSTFERMKAYYESDRRKNAGIFSVTLDSTEKDEGVVKSFFAGKGTLKPLNTLSEEEVVNIVKVDEDTSKNIGLLMDTNSAFTCSYVTGTPKDNDHEEFSKISMAVQYISKYALKVLRVDMGAYGAFVRAVNGAVYFYTYRTPCPFEAVEFYASVVDKILAEDIDLMLLDSAKRELFGDFLLYKSKREFARSKETHLRQGKNVIDVQSKVIDTVINFEAQDLKNIMQKYLTNMAPRTSICVGTNEVSFGNRGEGWTTVDYPL